MIADSFSAIPRVSWLYGAVGKGSWIQVISIILTSVILLIGIDYARMLLLRKRMVREVTVFWNKTLNREAPRTLPMANSWKHLHTTRQEAMDLLRRTF
jgi:hypothetical protein